MYIDTVILVSREKIKYIPWSLNQRWLRVIYWDRGSIDKLPSLSLHTTYISIYLFIDIQVENNLTCALQIIAQEGNTYKRKVHSVT
jgi:hypothetical protein